MDPIDQPIDGTAQSGAPPTLQRPAAPPTAPGSLQPIRPGWPRVLGILAIVFASIGLVATIVQVIAMPFAAKTSGVSLNAFGWALTILWIPITAMHLLAGILTVRFRGSGPALLILWAWINIAGTLLASVLMFTKATTTGTPVPPPTPLPEWFPIASAMFGMVISLIWPVFLLVYLNRPSRKAVWKSWR